MINYLQYLCIVNHLWPLISPYFLICFLFSIGFPEANKTKKKQTRSTTNPKATKGYTCTQYTQHILIIQVTLIYSFYKPINGLAIFCIIAIESWKSLGPQNLSTFNYSQRRQDPECDLGPPFVLKNGFFFSPFEKKKTSLHVRFLYRLSPSKRKRNSDWNFGQQRFLIFIFLFYPLASEGIPDYVYGMVGIIVILVFLLAAAMVYIRHQKRVLNARSNA